MTLQKHRKTRCGFSLAELLIVVAIIGVLAGIAFVFINPKDIDYVEYNRSAEAIATAVQNRLTEIRNTGDMTALRSLGVQTTKATMKTKSTAENTDPEKSKGGYRCLFNYSKDASGTITKNTLMSYILPFGAIDPDIADGYFAVIFQSDTGMCGEVFYSPEPFKECSSSYLLSLQASEETRKSENVGYYEGEVDKKEIAFANLPTPQLTITNYEELALQIHIPKVKQLEGKNLGLLISLTDKEGKAFAGGMSLAEAAIYSTFSLGGETPSQNNEKYEPIIKSQTVSTDSTYTMILDTMKTCNTVDSSKAQDYTPKKELKDTPKDKFENWAMRSDATATEKNKSNYFQLGDNSVITVTVYCLLDSTDENTQFPVDPTFLPRSASLTFNGWFNNYSSSTCEIACGRHLQNLNNLTELRPNLKSYLPEVTEKNGVYTYGDYNYGMANTYTDGSSNTSPKVEYDDIAEKYDRRDYVKSISKAKQINAIDFDNDGWKEKDGEEMKQILFTPVNLPKDFYYYGNYLTISHLKVDAPFYAGLFGYVYHVRLYDILLVNPSVTSQMPAHLSELYEMGVGGLIGTSRDSSHINNCQVYMTQENGKYDSANYRVTGECYVGGLIGFCEDENIENCSASVYTGYQKGADCSSQYVGGLIGCITGDSEIENCYAAGNLSGKYVGGLVGFIKEDSDPSGDDYRIETCYTAGHIEYAEESAAGILGSTGGYGGNPKSSLNITGNYCVIIYGEKEEGETTYKWNSSAPIYGTFEGDGFEWIQTHDFHYGDNYLKGKYAGFTFFAGASFENENKNYYIAQRGIKYQNSPYFEAMNKTVQDFEKNIADATDKEKLLEEIGKASDKIVWLKKLQTLDKIKELMERILYEVENEDGISPVTNLPYNKGGATYSEKISEDEDKYVTKYSDDIYIDLSRARVEGSEDSSSHKYLKLTLVQALNVIYNGTYTDDKGEVKSVTMSYDGSDGDKKKLNSTDKDGGKYGGVYTFMDYYNFLKKQYNTLLSDTASTEEKNKAQEALKDMLGDNSSETFEGINDEGEKKDYPFYQKGLFYQHFGSDLLHRLFDKAKDYYQDGKGDKTGELIYRYFRGLVTGNFYELLCDLGMSSVEREKMLEKAKISNIEEAIKALEEYPAITSMWKDGSPMSKYATEAAGYASTAKTKLEELLKKLKENYNKLLTIDANDEEEAYKDKEGADITAKWYTAEELQPLIDEAVEQLGKLYDLLDEHKLPDGTKEEDYDKYYDAVDSEGTPGDMRKLRDPVANFRRYAALCVASPNSGVEEALEVLKIKIENATDTSSDNLKKLIGAFTTNVDTYLGSGWGYTDSGYCLKNATELRNAARGYVHGSDTETRDHSLGFMYDYGNEKWTYHSDGSEDEDINPYTSYKANEDSTPKRLVPDGSYVDKNTNIVFNNVFPYHENAYTHYYPFPFVFGLEVEGEDIPTTYVLFHYGDWLTQDLWAENVDPTTAAIEEVAFMLNSMTSYLSSINNKDTVGNLQKDVDSLDNAIKGIISTVESALKESSSTTQKSELSSICSTIKGWMEADGAFAKLETVSQSAKNGNDAKKQKAQEIYDKLQIYKSQLEVLIEKIEGLQST